MNKKIYRLITSKNYLKLVKIYHSFFGENFKKDIDKQNIYNDKIHRLDVIQNLIKKYNFKKYLEIGCDQNEVFSQVKIENKNVLNGRICRFLTRKIEIKRILGLPKKGLE